MVRCRYFDMGSCRYGEQCRFAHASLSVHAKTFVPTIPPVNTGVQAGPDPSRSTPTQPSEEVVNEQSGVPTEAIIDTPITEPNQTKASSILVRKYGTSTVSFGAGANVQELKLPNDPSGVQIHRLPLSTTSQTAHDLVGASNFDLDKICFIKVFDVFSGHVPEKTAIIAVDNASDAHQLHADLKRQLEQDGYGNAVCQLRSSDGRTASLKVPYISCKWYKPSTVAYLHYQRSETAIEASKSLHESFINGRRVTAQYQLPKVFKRGMVFSVRLGNLALSTNKSHIEATVRDAHVPANIIFGQPSCLLDDENAADVVKRMLEKYEPLQTWEPDFHSNPKSCRALGRFSSTQKALLVQDELNKKKFPALGNSPLFISVVHVLKFPILSNVYAADRAEINIFLAGMEDMHYKIYNDDGEAKYVTIRLQSSQREAAVRAKQNLEQITTGEIVEQLQKKIWHSWFASPKGLAFVNSLAQKRGGYVYCDVRNELLRLHGTNLEKAALRHALKEKFQALQHSILQIPLPTDFLP